MCHCALTLYPDPPQYRPTPGVRLLNTHKHGGISLTLVPWCGLGMGSCETRQPEVGI